MDAEATEEQDQSDGDGAATLLKKRRKECGLPTPPRASRTQALRWNRLIWLGR